MARLALAVVLLTAGVSCDPASAPDGQQASKPSALGAKAENRNPRTATPFTVRRSLRVLRRAGRDEQRTSLLSRWSGVGQCESGGNPRTNTGNGYYGEYQETVEFWRSFGGLRYAARPDLASELAQTIVAARGFTVQGMGAFPVCGRYLRTAS